MSKMKTSINQIRSTVDNMSRQDQPEERIWETDCMIKELFHTSNQNQKTMNTHEYNK
jgi:hypothetical protein